MSHPRCSDPKADMKLPIPGSTRIAHGGLNLLNIKCTAKNKLNQAVIAFISRGWLVQIGIGAPLPQIACEVTVSESSIAGRIQTNWSWGTHAILEIGV